MALEANPPARPGELNADFLTAVIRKEYRTASSVKSFAVRNADAGVMSHVVFIDVEYSEESTSGGSPRRFVAKFLLPGVPLEHMFIVESNFYRQTAATTELPFKIPRAAYTSNRMIMIEYAASDRTFTPVEGCPEDLIIPVCACLGKLHAQFWGSPCNGLSTLPGIGSALDGLAKETQFPVLWKDFLDGVPIDDDARGKVAQICRRLSDHRLRDVHDAVHECSTRTLIHGDFHVANMLFKGDDVWLIDWATCGAGCPLLDLAFFVIVSVKVPMRQKVEAEMLAAYHSHVAHCGASLEWCRRMYRTCVLNQFLINVGFDPLSREITQKAKDPQALWAHFCEVNARACHALLDTFGEDLLPQVKTDEERAMPPQGVARL